MLDKATQRQLDTLKRMGVQHDQNITKAQASQRIKEALANPKRIDTEAIKAQHPLEQVVETFAHQEVGRDRKIFAPWRQESTPSVHIYPDGGWKDYGDGTSGDLFDLIGRIKFPDYDRHTHFIDVVDALGSLEIQPLPAPAVVKPKPPKPKTSINLERILDWADALPDRYRAYWRERGLTDNTIDRFLLGWDGHRLTIPAIYRGIPFGVRRRITPEDWGKAVEARSAAIERLTAEHPDWDEKQINRAAPELPGKYVSLKGDTVGIFNADVLNVARRVIVCEGELDCMLLDQLGYPAVTSTGGAAGWKAEWARFFAGCQQVYLLFDNDEAGRKGLKTVHAMMRRAKPLFLPDEVNDVADLWKTGHADAWLKDNVK